MHDSVMVKCLFCRKWNVLSVAQDGTYLINGYSITSRQNFSSNSCELVVYYKNVVVPTLTLLYFPQHKE